MPTNIQNAEVLAASHVDDTQLCDYSGCTEPALYELSIEGEADGSRVEGTFACCHECAEWAKWHPVKNEHVAPHPDDPRALEVAADG